MSELNNLAELTAADLDTVAGGLAITIGDAQGYAQSASNDFFQKNMTIAQQTFAGPNGSGTASAFTCQIIDTGAAQNIVVG
jgi:hypothetical protein